jgi:hypothetical protein
MFGELGRGSHTPAMQGRVLPLGGPRAASDLPSIGRQKRSDGAGTAAVLRVGRSDTERQIALGLLSKVDTSQRSVGATSPSVRTPKRHVGCSTSSVDLALPPSAHRDRPALRHEQGDSSRYVNRPGMMPVTSPRSCSIPKACIAELTICTGWALLVTM